MIKRKSFFLESSCLDEVGSRLALETDDYFDKIYETYVARGYNLREITQILMGSITLSESKCTLKFRKEYDIIKRDELADERIEASRKKKSVSKNN